MDQNLTNQPTASQKKTPVNVTPKLSKAGTGSSTPQVVIFTPEQLQKLGFAEQFQDVINKQVNPANKNQKKRGPYKKRHPKLVKDRITKPKILNKVENSESITKSLKRKFNRVVKANKNLLPVSVNSESSVSENIIESEKTDVTDGDAEKCKQLKGKKRQVIPEIIKLKTSPWRRRHISNKNEAESSIAKEDCVNVETDLNTTMPTTKNNTVSDLTILEQANTKKEVVRDLFNVKIRETCDVLEQTVKEVEQLEREEVIPEVANLKANLNSSKMNVEVGAKEVEDYPLQDNLNEAKVEQPNKKKNQDIQSEQIENKKPCINNDKIKSSEIAQANTQLNEENVSLELVQLHQTRKQSITVCEITKKNSNEDKNVKEKNTTAEVVQIKRRIQETKIDDTTEKSVEHEKFTEKNKVSSYKSRPSVRVDYQTGNENIDEGKQFSGEEKAVVLNVIVENEKEALVPAKPLSPRRKGMGKIGESSDKPQEENKHEEEKGDANKNQKKESKEVPVSKSEPPTMRRQSVRKSKQKSCSESEVEKIKDLNEEFAISNVGQLKSPSQRRLSVRIDYVKNNENIADGKKLNEEEKKGEALEENIEDDQHQNEEFPCSNFGQLKSPSKRRLSVRIDYAKNNQVNKFNEAEEKEEVIVADVVKSKPLLTRRQSARKGQTGKEKIEEDQPLDEEFGQLKSPSKRRLSVRIDYEKSNENVEDVKKSAVEKKEEASISVVVHSKTLLTKRQNPRKSESKEEKIEEPQHLNEEFSITKVGLLKSPSKRRLSLRIDYVRSNKNVEEVEELSEEEKKVLENKQQNIILENEKTALIVPEVASSKPLLTTGNSVKKNKDKANERSFGGKEDDKRKVSPNKNAELPVENVVPLKSPLRGKQSMRTEDLKKIEDNKEETVEKLSGNERKAAQKEVVQFKLSRKSMRICDNESNITKENTVGEVQQLKEEKKVSLVNQNRRSRSLNAKKEEKQSNQNEKDGTHPEIIRFKPQLKRRKNARIHETKNDDIDQENQETANHNSRQNINETKDQVVEEGKQSTEEEDNKLFGSKSTDTKEETVNVKLKMDRNRKKTSLKNDETNVEAERSNQNDIDLKDCEINKNVTVEPQREEEQLITENVVENCSTEENQKAIQLENMNEIQNIEENKQKNIQIVANEVVFFSPSDIQNMTKSSKCKPIAMAADPALVILQKSALLQENQFENEKLELEEEEELIVKEEKIRPKCYTRKSKSKANVDQNLPSCSNEKSEKVGHSTHKDGEEIKVEKDKRELGDPKNSSEQISAPQTKSGQKRKLETTVEPDENLSSKIDDSLSSERTKLTDNAEILPQTLEKKARKSTLISKKEESEKNVTLKSDTLKDNSLSSEKSELVKNTEVFQKFTRRTGRPRKSTSNSKTEVVETVESEKNVTIKSDTLKNDSLSSEKAELVKNTEVFQKSPRKTGRPRKSTSTSKTEVVETVESAANLKTEALEDDSLRFETTKLTANDDILEKSLKKAGTSRKSKLISEIKTVESEGNLPINTDPLEDNSLSSETTELPDNAKILQKPSGKRARKSILISKTEVVETVESEVNLPVKTGAQEVASLRSDTTGSIENIDIFQKSPRRRGRPKKSTLTSKIEVGETEVNLTMNTEALKNDSVSSETTKLADNIPISHRSLKKAETLVSKVETVESGRPEDSFSSSEVTKLLDNAEISQKPPKKLGRFRKSTLILEIEGEDNSLISETINLKENPDLLQKSQKKKGRPRKLEQISKNELVESEKTEANLSIKTNVTVDSLSCQTTKLADTNEILQTPRKKVGRPRKSRVLPKTKVVETMETEVTETSPETPTSLGRSKRKRKAVNYSKLSKANDESGVESDEGVVFKKSKRCKKVNNDIFEIDVNITPNPQTDEVDCSFSEVKKYKKSETSKHAKLFHSLINEAKLSDTPQTSKEASESSEKINVDANIKEGKKKSSSNTVTCDVCKLEMDRKAWVDHKLKRHNNLAWKVGEKPMDLNDTKFVLGILNQMYLTKKHSFYCDKCENTMRSVQGYLSHRSRCQKSTQDLIALQVTCEHCERVMLPVSMYTHLKLCRGLRPNDECSDTMQAQEDSPLPRKRKAAEKASQFITALKEDDEKPKEKNFNYSKQWIKNYNFEVAAWAKKIILEQCREGGSAKCCFKGCEYQSSDCTEIFSHFKECTNKIEGFSCKLCLSTFESKSEIIEHLKKGHADEYKMDTNFDGDESNDSYDENDEEEIGKKRKDNRGSGISHPFRPSFQLKFSKELCPISVSKAIVFPTAWKWTFDFCSEHFSEQNLFSNWRNSCLQNLDSNEIGTYLPKQKYSVCTSIMKCKKYVDPLASDYDWKRFMLFESSRSNSGVSSIFCGGTISAMAWVPTPYKVQVCEQILAVAVQPDLETKYKVNQFYSEPGIIQFWNCGLFETAPKLQFCIAHDYNPIWSLEWCPSGCYDVEVKENESRRLGILAVGSGNSHVYLYSVHEPQATNGKIIKMKPIKKLSLIVNKEQYTATLKAHVSKISWTKASGHQHIAVGYTNGVVALYNLNNLSDLLKYKAEDELETQQPYLTINAHVHSVTALTLSHISNGCRWLMTASADRTIKYWDLREPTTPIMSTCKFVVTDGVWLTHWLCSILCFDDCCNTGITQTSLHQVRNFKSDTCSIMHSNSAIQCINANDWINGIIQGNAAGEIQAFFPHQLLHGMDNSSKHFKKKKVILSYCRLVEKNVSIEERLKRESEKLKLMASKPKEVVDISQITSNPNRYKPEPVTYKGAQSKYGVVFCDYELNKLDEIASTFTDYTNSHSEKYYSTRPNLYPMQCVTKVQFNPNRSAYNYYAAGYQIGFVRIFPMKFITSK